MLLLLCAPTALEEDGLLLLPPSLPDDCKSRGTEWVRECAPLPSPPHPTTNLLLQPRFKVYLPGTSRTLSPPTNHPAHRLVQQRNLRGVERSCHHQGCRSSSRKTAGHKAFDTSTAFGTGENYSPWRCPRRRELGEDLLACILLAEVESTRNRRTRERQANTIEPAEKP